jgi:hypothetical protein
LSIIQDLAADEFWITFCWMFSRIGFGTRELLARGVSRGYVVKLCSLDTLVSVVFMVLAEVGQCQDGYD